MKSDIIRIAVSQLGQEEFEKGSNPEILKYLEVTNTRGALKDDSTAWCCAYVNWVLNTAGFCHSNRLDARSYLEVGFSTAMPERGDIAVLWRESPNSWKGHVGFLMNQKATTVLLLGGNQDNKVGIKEYNKDRILSYRVPYRIR